MYFKNIHILRGFAALLVLVYHVIELHPWADFPREGVLLWFRRGWIGVDLFFVISGFVITLAAVKLYRRDKSAASKIYIRHRLARISPLYFLTLLVALFLVTPSLLKSSGIEWNLLSHALFIHSWDPEMRGAINGPNWSVSIEMQFYVMIILLLPWLSRTGPWRVLLTLVALSWIWRGGVYFLSEVYDWKSHLIMVYTVQLPGLLDEFGYGIFLALLVLGGESEGRQPKPSSTSAFDNWFVWALLFSVVAYITFAILDRWIIYWNQPMMVIFWRTLAGLSGLLLLIVAMKINVQGVFDRYVLAPFRYLGEISYGIYLWHMPVILSLKRVDINDPMYFLLLTIFSVLILSALTWHFLEKPFIEKYR